ncbi:MAG: YkgJ family cysteine cluster protein [Oligoflexia bacterium]|nr:YkgJ family cysteine cluster protein [Oligoflexia bacterium]
MYSKQDRVSAWVRYKEELCMKCVGACCKMPVEVTRDDLNELGLAPEASEYSDKKLAKILQQRKIIKNYRASTGLFLIQERSDGSCYFLVNERCSVYEKRPQVCRKFPTEMGNRLGYCPYTPSNVKRI